MARLSLLLRYAIIGLSLLTVCHFSVRPYFSTSRSPDPGRLARAYESVVRFGERLGLGPQWRMYSPTQKHVFRAEWFASGSDGEWVRLEMPDLSPRHRSRRSFLSSWILDFKLARIQDNYLRFFPMYHPALRRLYIEHQKRVIAQRTGDAPSRLRVILRAGPIPPPRDKGSWTPGHADYATVVYDVVE